MISTRDTIVLGNGYHLPDRNAFLISTKTIIDESCRYCDIPKPDKGVVRMYTESIFYVQLVKSDAISFKMIGRDDLKLKYMPNAVLNYISQGHLPFELMKTIHRTIRNFEGTMWEEKIKERGEYYTEIESKVYAQLEKWEKDGTANIDPDDMYIEDKRSKNEPVKLETTLQGKYCANSEMLNSICVWGEKLFVGIAMVAILSVLIDFMPGPDMLLEQVGSTMELICNDNKPCALIVMPLFLLFVLSILLISRVKRESKEIVIADQPSFRKDNDTMLKANVISPLDECQPTTDLRGITVTSSPQSPPEDTLQELQMQTPRSSNSSQQKVGKIRSKLRTLKKVVPFHGKKKNK
jgi:hypothetical protein